MTTFSSLFPFQGNPSSAHIECKISCTKISCSYADFRTIIDRVALIDAPDSWDGNSVEVLDIHLTVQTHPKIFTRVGRLTRYARTVRGWFSVEGLTIFTMPDPVGI